MYREAGKPDRFLGVPRDRLPTSRKFKHPFGLIVNTSKSSDDNGGTHWTSVWIQDACSGDFFCSFGKPALFYGLEIHNYILQATPKSNGMTKDNLIQLQHPNSDMCGAFALCFIYHRARGLSLSFLFRIREISNPTTFFCVILFVLKFTSVDIQRSVWMKTC